MRTLFLTWSYLIQHQLRPMQMAAQFLTGSFVDSDSEGSSLEGGRGSRAGGRVREAARRSSRKPRPGGEMVGNKLRIHIDDPGAGAAFAGSHPTQQRTKISGPSKVGKRTKKGSRGRGRKR